MIKYKLVRKNMTTHNGHPWVQGVPQHITKPGTKLCSDEVYHYYDTPEIAIIMNVIHANYDEYDIWEVECNEVAHDGVKGGAKSMTLMRTVPRTVITTDQRVAIAIKIAMIYYNNPGYHTWAACWLAGTDRSAESAEAAARAAEAAARAAAGAAARAAAGAAEAAAGAAAGAARAAAWAAEEAAWAAAWAAEDAALAAEEAARAAEDAARAAAWAAAGAAAGAAEYRTLLKNIITEVIT